MLKRTVAWCRISKRKIPLFFSSILLTLGKIFFFCFCIVFSSFFFSYCSSNTINYLFDRNDKFFFRFLLTVINWQRLVKKTKKKRRNFTSGIGFLKYYCFASKFICLFCCCLDSCSVANTGDYLVWYIKCLSIS